MTRSVTIALTICVLLATSCTSGMRMFSATPARLSTSVAEGRSPDLHTGNPFGYWLWKEDDGTWHLRTTAARQAHRFQGAIRPSIAGSIQALSGVNLNPGGRRRPSDVLRMEGSNIVFEFTTHQGLVGFDFQLVGRSSLEFDLRIDQDSDPGKIFIGKAQANPEKAHLILSP
jgi:hypothetical protein